MLFTPGERIHIRQFCGVVVGYAPHGGAPVPGMLRLRLDTGNIVFLPVTQRDLAAPPRASLAQRLLTRDVPGPTDGRRTRRR